MGASIRAALQAVTSSIKIPGRAGTRAYSVPRNAPATVAMTDFQSAPMMTTPFDTPIDKALRQMKFSGARFCFVLGQDGELAGSVTSYDIQGEKPVRYMTSVGCSETSCAWNDVQVDNIMEPIAGWRVLDHAVVTAITLEQVAELLAQSQQRYVVVVEGAAEPGEQQVRGLISAARVQLLLGA